VLIFPPALFLTDYAFISSDVWTVNERKIYAGILSAYLMMNILKSPPREDYFDAQYFRRKVTKLKQATRELTSTGWQFRTGGLEKRERSGKSYAIQLGAFDSLARTRLTAQPDTAQRRSDAAVPWGLSYVVLAHQAIERHSGYAQFSRCLSNILVVAFEGCLNRVFLCVFHDLLEGKD